MHSAFNPYFYTTVVASTIYMYNTTRFAGRAGVGCVMRARVSPGCIYIQSSISVILFKAVRLLFSKSDTYFVNFAVSCWLYKMVTFTDSDRWKLGVCDFAIARYLWLKIIWFKYILKYIYLWYAHVQYLADFDDSVASVKRRSCVCLTTDR